VGVSRSSSTVAVRAAVIASPRGGQLCETDHAVQGRCGLGRHLEVGHQLPVARGDGKAEEGAASLLADQQLPHRLRVGVAGQEQPQPGWRWPLQPNQVVMNTPWRKFSRRPGDRVGVQESSWRRTLINGVIEEAETTIGSQVELLLPRGEEAAMEEVVAAALVGAGVGYAARLSQEQVRRGVRALTRNELVAGTARRGRDVLVAGARGGALVAQASASGGLQVARSAARSGAQVAQAGARGGAQVVAAAAGRGTGSSAPARAVRVPVDEERPAPRRRARTRAAAKPRATAGARGGAEAGTRGTRARGGTRARASSGTGRGTRSGGNTSGDQTGRST
jgi:hypothetical protein